MLHSNQAFKSLQNVNKKQKRFRERSDAPKARLLTAQMYIRSINNSSQWLDFQPIPSPKLSEMALKFYFLNWCKGFRNDE